MKAKVVSVLLCMAMVTTMAVGCGSSSDSSESTDSSKKESTDAEPVMHKVNSLVIIGSFFQYMMRTCPD